MTFFDTHAHFAEENKPFDAWFRRAADANVTRVLLGTSGWDNTVLARECADAVPCAFFTAGIHPHEAADETSHAVNEYASFTDNPKCLAIGEIGLDYFYDISPERQQREVFDAFLNLALAAKKPAVIHCRDKQDSGPAYDHAYEHLSAFAAKGGRFVLHAFAGSPDWMDKFLDLGAFFGIGGMVTFKRADNIRALAVRMPPDRFFLETDSPYLAPVPYRGQPNHPAYIPVIAASLAKCRNIPVEELADAALRNSLKFFTRKEEL